MSAFEISSELKSAFLVNRSKIEGRLDPYFYKPIFQELTKKLRAVSHTNLGSLVSFSAESWDQKQFFGSSFPYIEISEINTSTGEINVVRQVSKDQAPSRAKKIVREGDIIVSTTRPSRGAISFISNTYNFHIASTGFSVLRGLKTEAVSKRYLFFMLRQHFSLKQMEQRSSGGNYPAITEDELKQIVIPLSDEAKQQQVIEIFSAAFTEKSQKEAQAAEQISRIDRYLLTELGISVPEADDALEHRMFTVNFSESSGKRFDPLFFYKNFLDQVPAGRFPVEPLSRHVTYFQTGFAAGKGDQSTDSTEVIQLRPTNLTDDRELVFDRNVYIHRDALTKRPGDIMQPGEVLFNNTNSQKLVGKSVLFDLDDEYFCSNHMTRIGTAGSLHPDYLAHLLNLYQRQKVFFRICTNWNNQSGANNGVLSGLLIPIPPIDQQKAIARTITDLRSSAKKLRQEAKDELEKARLEVERMILEE